MDNQEQVRKCYQSKHLMPGKAKWIAMAPFIFFSSAIMQFDESSFPIALPKIQEELNLTSSESQWLTTAYYLGTASLAVPLSYVGQRYGLVFTTIIESFVVILLYLTSFFVSNFIAIIILRFVIGAASSGVLVNRNTIAAMYTDPSIRTQSITYTLTLRSSLNFLMPLIAGLVLDAIPWKFLNMFTTAFAVATIFSLIPFQKLEAKKSFEKFDFLGSIFLSLFVTLFDVAIVQVSQKQFVAASAIFVVSVLLCVLFVFIEKKHLNPIVPLKLLKNPLSTVLVFNFVNYMNMNSLSCLMPQLYRFFGKSSSEIGYFTTAAAVMGFAATFIVQITTKKCVFRILVLGEYVFIIILEVFLIIFCKKWESATAFYILCQFFAMGATQTSQAQLMNCVPRSYSARVAGFPTLTRTIGSSLASCISLSVLDAIKKNGDNMFFVGFDVALAIQLVFIVIVLILSIFRIGNQNNERGKWQFKENQIRELSIFQEEKDELLISSKEDEIKDDLEDEKEEENSLVVKE